MAEKALADHYQCHIPEQTCNLSARSASHVRIFGRNWKDIEYHRKGLLRNTLKALPQEVLDDINRYVNELKENKKRCLYPHLQINPKTIKLTYTPRWNLELMSRREGSELPGFTWAFSSLKEHEFLKDMINDAPKRIHVLNQYQFLKDFEKRRLLQLGRLILASYLITYEAIDKCQNQLNPTYKN